MASGEKRTNTKDKITDIFINIIIISFFLSLLIGAITNHFSQVCSVSLIVLICFILYFSNLNEKEEKQKALKQLETIKKEIETIQDNIYTYPQTYGIVFDNNVRKKYDEIGNLLYTYYEKTKIFVISEYRHEYKRDYKEETQSKLTEKTEFCGNVREAFYIDGRVVYQYYDGRQHKTEIVTENFGKHHNGIPHTIHDSYGNLYSYSYSDDNDDCWYSLDKYYSEYVLTYKLYYYNGRKNIQIETAGNFSVKEEIPNARKKDVLKWALENGYDELYEHLFSLGLKTNERVINQALREAACCSIINYKEHQNLREEKLIKLNNEINELRHEYEQLKIIRSECDTIKESIKELEQNNEIDKLRHEYGRLRIIKDECNTVTESIRELEGVAIPQEEERYKKIVEKLLKYGADVDSADDYNRTAFMLAASKGYTEIAKLLLDKGSFIDGKTNSHGRTALILASYNGYKDTVKLLLEYGADTEIKDKEGKNAIYYAAKNGHNEIVDLLKTHKKIFSIKDK